MIESANILNFAQVISSQSIFDCSLMKLVFKWPGYKNEISWTTSQLKSNKCAYVYAIQDDGCHVLKYIALKNKTCNIHVGKGHLYFFD